MEELQFSRTRLRLCAANHIVARVAGVAQYGRLPIAKVRVLFRAVGADGTDLGKGSPDPES